MKCKIRPARCLELAFGGNRPRMMPHVYNAQNNLTAKNDLFFPAASAQPEQALHLTSLPDKRRPLEVTHGVSPQCWYGIAEFKWHKMFFSLLTQKEMCLSIYNRKHCLKKIYPPVRPKIFRMSAKSRINFKQNSKGWWWGSPRTSNQGMVLCFGIT